MIGGVQDHTMDMGMTIRSRAAAEAMLSVGAEKAHFDLTDVFGSDKL